jgi:hypothetical protein
LNQHCVLEPDLESILLARALKIVLQQYRAASGIPRGTARCRSSAKKWHNVAVINAPAALLA